MLFIFDVDGTLTIQEQVMAARLDAQCRYIAEHKGISLEEAKALRQATKERLSQGKGLSSAYVFMDLGFSRQEFFNVLNSLDVNQLTIPQPGCEEVLERLSRNHTLVTYTNTPSKANARTLDTLGVERYFKRSFCADQLEESKPSTRNIEYIIQEMGFTKDQAVMIGNSYEKDVLPAKEYGIKAVLFDFERRYSEGLGVPIIYELKTFESLGLFT